MSCRPIAAAVAAHVACAIVVLVEAGEAVWLAFPRFAAALMLAWIGLFASSAALARCHRWMAVLLPLVTSALTLGAALLWFGGTISPRPAAAPLVVLLWAVVYFWPSMAGSFVGLHSLMAKEPVR
jgi:hypothetical protein